MLKPEWLLPTFAALFCWGLWAFLPKLTVRVIDPLSAIVYETIGGIVTGGLIWTLIGPRIATEPRGVIPALLTGILGVCGALAYLYAIRKGPVILIATVTALYPALTILLAGLFLGESVNLRQAFGLVLGLLAIVLIAG